MRYPLAKLIQRPSRRPIELRPITPPQALASTLYARCYRPIVARIEAAQPRLLAAYERGLSQLTQDAATDDAATILSTLGDELQRLVLALVPSLREWAVSVETWHRGRWRGNVLSATGVDLGTILIASGEPTSIAETVAWNTSLIRDVSDQARSRMSSAVFAAFQARKPARDLAAELRGVSDMSKRRSLGIAADQLSKLSGSLDTERMADAGIEQWRYRHGRKKHPRPHHAAREGKIYSLATNKEIGGPDQIKPGDAPQEPPWCSCRKQAVVTFD